MPTAIIERERQDGSRSMTAARDAAEEQDNSFASISIFLRRGASASFLVKLSSTALSFLTGVFLARMLGPEHYGIYAYAMAVVTLMVVPAGLGLPPLIVRQLAAYRQESEWGLMRGLLRRANQGVAVGAVVLTMAAALVAWLLAGHLPPGGLATFLLALIMVPLLAFAAVRTAALQGLHHVVVAQLPEGLLRPGLFLAVAATAYLELGQRFDAVWAMGMQTAATAVAFAIGLWLLLRRRPTPLRSQPPRYKTREWGACAWPMLFVSGVHMMNVQVDVVMLGAMGAAHDVGVYRVASRGAEFVLFVLMAANLTAAPVFSRLFYRNDRQQLQRAVTLTARMVMLFALPVALTLMIWGTQILRLMFGEAYVGASTALAILAAGQLVNAGVGSVGTLLNMTGHERASAKGAAVAAVLNIVLNASLIPYWGINGAAVATALSIAVWNILLATAVYKHLRIDSTAFGGLAVTA